VKTEGMMEIFLGNFRVQLYWPELELGPRVWFVGLDTVARVVRDPRQRYHAAGFKVLGFGLGLDHHPETAARRAALHTTLEESK
jgi:hypothetical protein